MLQINLLDSQEPFRGICRHENLLRNAVARCVTVSEKTFIFAFMRVLFFENPESVPPQELEADMALLPQFRRDRMLAIRRFESRVLGVKAFLLLMRALREEYGLAECPQIVFGGHGKPVFADRPDIHFSLSHCRVGAMCVVAGGNVGCDMEDADRRVSDAVLGRCFNAEEAAAVRSSASPSLEFARLWTRKEAAGKYWGCGIDDAAPDILGRAEKEGLQITSGMNVSRNYVYSLCTGGGAAPAQIL